MTANTVEMVKTEVSREEGILNSLEETMAKVGFNQIPYKTTLCFDKLIDIIEKKAIDGDAGEQLYAKVVMEHLDKESSLKGPLNDCELANNKESLELLMLAIIPSALRDSALIKVSPPLSMQAIYESPAFKHFTEDYNLNFRFTCPTEAAYGMVITNAGRAILNKFYNQNTIIESPVQIIKKDPKTGMVKYFKTEMNFDFVEIKPLKPLKPLTKKEISSLLSDVYNTKLWLEHMPPENFEFQGFVIGNLIDISEEEALSRTRFGLLKKNAVTEKQNIKELEKLVANYLGLPELKLGITALDYPIENQVAHRYKIHFNFLAEEANHLLDSNADDSIYERACRSKEIITIDDLTSLKNTSNLEQKLIEKGFRSMLIAPLKSKNDKIIGLLEIGHQEPSAISGFVKNKFTEIINLFSLAVERSRDEIDNQIEAVIREKYTAVHPSVEWRFVEASYNYLEKLERNEPNPAIESIIFEEVHPLYAQADIVGSSTKRNNAIQADLITNLSKAHDLLVICSDIAHYPLVDQYSMKVEQNLEALKQVFNSNDESRLLEFLFDEVHPLFRQLRCQYPDLKDAVDEYFSYIDPHLGIVYQERKAYEESVTMLNNAMGNYLEQEELESQQVIPHYFEKYKTDGVEYDIYAGQSILNKGRFNEMHLRNLRLSQLINMVEITRIVENIQDELPVSLTTAQLVFVYGSSLSIRFRMDEKQFDVDGAYNVRYEILKKRIDKALIEGTGERLTQSGKIAIVYLQEKDRLEYLDYLDYLKNRQYIEDEIEDVQLGKLQGVQGLRALRVTVKS